MIKSLNIRILNNKKPKAQKLPDLFALAYVNILILKSQILLLPIFESLPLKIYLYMVSDINRRIIRRDHPKI